MARHGTVAPADVEERALVLGGRHQGLLDFRGDPQLLLEARLLGRLAVEPGVLDGDGRLGRPASRARRASPAT